MTGGSVAGAGVAGGVVERPRVGRFRPLAVEMRAVSAHDDFMREKVVTVR